jgi:hypothetical protein
MSPKKFASFLLLSTIASTATPGAFAADDWITLAQESPPLVAESTKAVNTSEFISLQKGQDKLQLFLTYMNGSATAPSFERLRISSASMNYVTEKQFAGKKDLTLNVTGDLTWSGNQLLISGAGPKGATFNWVLRTPRPKFTGITPSSVFSGNSITITGTNFCSSPAADVVTIGGQPARVVSAAANQLVVEVPEETKSGNLPVTLKVAGIDVPVPSNATVAITAQPYLKSLSAPFVAPGETVTIYGDGFSSDVANDEVYIGPFKCPIVSASENSLTVRAVGALSDGWYATNIMNSGGFFQVKVLVNGVKARNQLTIRSSDV